MKNFKFRAWHKGANQMLTSRDQGYQGEVFKWLKEGQTIEIMQSTGLHDKNCKEIFEGDILEGHDDGLVTVCWPEKSTGWLCEFKDNGVIGLDEMCIFFGNNATIIGNIYENGELLK